MARKALHLGVEAQRQPTPRRPRVPAPLLAGVAALLAAACAGCSEPAAPRAFLDAGAIDTASCESIAPVQARGASAYATVAASERAMEVRIEAPPGWAGLDAAANWSVAQGAAVAELTHPDGSAERIPTSPFQVRLVDPKAGTYVLRIVPDPAAASVAFELRLAGASAGC